MSERAAIIAGCIVTIILLGAVALEVHGLRTAVYTVIDASPRSSQTQYANWDTNEGVRVQIMSTRLEEESPEHFVHRHWEVTETARKLFSPYLRNR